MIEGLGGDGRAVVDVFEGLPKVNSGKLDAADAKGGVDGGEEKSSDLRIERVLEGVVGEWGCSDEG